MISYLLAWDVFFGLNILYSVFSIFIFKFTEHFPQCLQVKMSLFKKKWSNMYFNSSVSSRNDSLSTAASSGILEIEDSIVDEELDINGVPVSWVEHWVEFCSIELLNSLKFKNKWCYCINWINEIKFKHIYNEFGNWNEESNVSLSVHNILGALVCSNNKDCFLFIFYITKI